MEKYIAEAKEKATGIEKYAVKNGVVCRKYVDRKMILIFRALYDGKHKSTVYYNCVTHKFCNYSGK